MTTPSLHGHLHRPLGLLECGVGGLWLCLWDVIVECDVARMGSCVARAGTNSYLPGQPKNLARQLKLPSGNLYNKCWSHFDNACLRGGGNSGGSKAVAVEDDSGQRGGR